MLQVYIIKIIILINLVYESKDKYFFVDQSKI